MALNFNATGERVTLPSDVGLLAQTLGGVLVVFKVAASTSSKLLMTQVAAFNEQIALQVFASDHGTLPGRLRGTWRTPNGLAIEDSLAAVDDDTWRWAYWRRNGDDFELYTGTTDSDGALQGSQTNAAVGTDASVTTNWLGNNTENDAEHANGDLARCAFWKGEAPTLAQVETFIGTGVPPGTPYWYELLDDASDWGDNNQDGTINGTVDVVDHPALLGFDLSFGTLVAARNRVHDLLHRPAQGVSAPSDLHLAFIESVDGSDNLIEKNAEDGYARVAYAQGAPTAGEATNPAAYTFPEPTTDYDIVGVALVEGSSIGSGRMWGAVLYGASETVTAANRTIAIGDLTSIGRSLGS